MKRTRIFVLPMALCLTTFVAATFFIHGVAFAEQPTTAKKTTGKKHAAAKAKSTGNKYLLRYKFQMGEVLRYGVKHSTHTRTTIDKTTQRAESKSESIKAWKVTDVLPNGEMEFVHVVEHVRMSNRLPSQTTTTYDSEQDKTPPRGFEQAARAVGVPISIIRLAPDGEILGREEKIAQPEHTPDMPITLRLPSEPIAVGKRWNESYDVPMQRKSGTKLQVRTRRLCKLLKVQNGIATISVQYQVLTPIDAYIEAQLVERLAKGTVRFNIAKGRIVGQQQEVDKRILGFAGGTSSMHFVSRLEERLLKPGERLARK